MGAAIVPDMCRFVPAFRTRAGGLGGFDLGLASVQALLEAAAKFLAREAHDDSRPARLEPDNPNVVPSADGFPPTRPLCRRNGAASGATSPAYAAARGAAK